MVRKTFFKTISRSLRANTGRFVAISVIVFLGIAFVSGLGTLAPSVTDSFANYLSRHGVADITVKCSSPVGFTSAEIAAVSSNGKISDVMEMTVYDMKSEGKNTRIYAMPLSSSNFAAPYIVSGRLPANQDEVAAERASDSVLQTNIGDTVTVFGSQKTIVGIVANPSVFSIEGDIDMIDRKPLETVLYLDSTTLSLPLPVTDIQARVTAAREHEYLSSTYYSAVEECADDLSDMGFTVLTLKDNASCATLEAYEEKINVICAIFPIFFIAVAALVVLTTMSRLVEEERAAIGCCKTLGYNDRAITIKYVFMALVCSVVSAGAGLAAGIFLLPATIYPAFATMFFLPAMSVSPHVLPGAIAAVLMIAAVAGVTLFVTKRELGGEPAEILRPKAPKSGKKIFIERLKFLWKPLPFRFKSTLRNIFRYVNHFVMTVVSVAGSTALVFAGFALLNVSDGEQSFATISAVIIAFALLLCAFVIYNLTNMNIGERKREIATLKVLGYHEAEVSGYIYREIFIMAIIGVIFGIPLGCLLVHFVLWYLGFGAFSDVMWYSYVLSALLVPLFVGIVDLLLVRKIRTVDMTSSLKSVE